MEKQSPRKHRHVLSDDSEDAFSHYHRKPSRENYLSAANRDPHRDRKSRRLAGQINHDMSGGTDLDDDEALERFIKSGHANGGSSSPFFSQFAIPSTPTLNGEHIVGVEETQHRTNGNGNHGGNHGHKEGALLFGNVIHSSNPLSNRVSRSVLGSPLLPKTAPRHRFTIESTDGEQESSDSEGDSSGSGSSSDESSDTPRESARKSYSLRNRRPVKYNVLPELPEPSQLPRRRPDPRSERDRRSKPVKSKKREASDRLDVDTFTFTEQFSDMAGLEAQIQTLKRMILWPLLYPSLYTDYGVHPPRGVLFHGPPGTGKTMMAKALVNEYGRLNGGNQKVTFFMKSASDILSKWIGVAEKTLHRLFADAAKCAPSIIFFDELDGLAPARTAKQDQSHISLVSTLLQLMDGVSAQPGVIVIGATNRIDEIDPALRRTGRFDTELYFGLPCSTTRKALLSLQISRFPSRCRDVLLNPDFLDTMALVTEGFCGADLKGLIREAVLHSAVRSIHPLNGTLLHNTLQQDDFFAVLPSASSNALRTSHTTLRDQFSQISLQRDYPPRLQPYIERIHTFLSQ